MRILLLGASGMVGQGVLRECLLAPDVEEVVAPLRHPLPGDQEPRLRQIVQPDFSNWDSFDLTGFDACFYCLGVSALGKSEADYRHITYDLTLALAHPLLADSPQAAFVYVSGAGTDAHGKAMWARVKGQTEDALQSMPFRSVYCFRPGYIQPLHGIRSKVGWYQAMYSLVSWTYPLIRRFASAITSTEAVGLAMLQVAATAWQDRVLSTASINRAAAVRRSTTAQEKAPRR